MAAPIKITWWYEQIFEWELMNPGGKMGDCAAYFEKTESWLSTVRNSDSFKAYREAQLEEHRIRVSGTVVEKLTGVAMQALDVMSDKIEAEKTDMKLAEVRETASLALKSLGYGIAPRGGNGNSNGVQVNVISAETVTREELAAAREGMKLINAPREEAVGSEEGAPAITQTSSKELLVTARTGGVVEAPLQDPPGPDGADLDGSEESSDTPGTISIPAPIAEDLKEAKKGIIHVGDSKVPGKLAQFTQELSAQEGI